MGVPKLYFTTKSCGAATYIAAKRGGVEIVPLLVQFQEDRQHYVLKTKEKFNTINPKYNVPTLQFEDGTILNENTGTLYWVGEAGNLAGQTALEKAQVVNTLGFLASEVHVKFRRAFRAESEATKASAKEELRSMFELLNRMLQGKEYLVGNSFTVADSYLYIILTWQAWIGLDFSDLINVQAFFERVKDLDFIQEAHKEMAKLDQEQI